MTEITNRTTSELAKALLRLHPYNVLAAAGIRLVDIGGTHVLKVVPAIRAGFVLPVSTDPFTQAQAVALATRLYAEGVYAE